ncbi:MAG: DUF3238 domain-containing protein, partial [Alphaproteobacteria bacterium]|nr:DUF3238 domain-containing protein [Alphaproteobacteria bacterium]
FGSVQRTVAVEFGHAAAFAVQGPAVRALTSGEIELGERAPFAAPDVTTLGWAASTAVQAALAANPAFTAIVAAARTAAEAGDVSIGIGPAVSGGLGAGAQLGVGIIFAPGNTIGAYGSADLLVGAIASVSLTVQVTILRGGVSSFEGMSMTAGFSAGEGIVGGGAVIFDAQGAFLGVSFQIGIGAGLSPLEVYASVQRGVASQLGTAIAFGHAGPPAWAQVIGPDDVAQAQRYAPAWEDLFNWRVPAGVSSAVTGRGSGFEVMPISAAYGSLNLDRYEVRCDRLPTGMTAAEVLSRFRLNINDFVDTRNSEFEPYDSSDAAKWSGSNPVGALFYIDIAGPDNAAVVGSMVESNRFRFTTIKTPRSGEHPVSGHREFGVREEGDGHVFYTRAADRATDGIAETIVFAGADHLWKSFQTKLAAFINDNGGSATILPRFAERFHPDVVRILYPAGAAQALGGFDPYAVEVKYRMFIPSPVVKGPPLHDDYGGDGRGFSYSSGSSRGEIVATVNLSTGLGIDGIDVTRRDWGESTSYDSDDTVAVSGKPDWWRDKAPGASVKSRDTLRASADNLNIVPGTGGQRGVRVYAEGASAVTIHAAGANPLVTMSPDIDADLSVLFRNNNGLIQAMALGNHDGFPAHELYVNGELIYSYDPVAAGNGPMSLVGTSDIDVDTGWKTVARTNIVRTGGQALGQARAMEFNESFTINWDEVQQIAQPTDMSCWATAAAMVIGWRDRMSLSPQTIAEIGGRSIIDGLDPSKVEDFARDMGLEFEHPQSYTKAGFRALLEENGPLWVGTAPSSLHVVVVTGIYNEGERLFVRITDPWDRVVGTPGAPGPVLSTHQQGSRYIMRWEDFVAEYERAATDFSSVNLQILHSGGTNGRLPNWGDRVPPGYAQALKSAEPKEAAAAAPVAAPLTAVLSQDVAQVAAPLTESANAVGQEPAAAWRVLVESFDPALGQALAGLPDLAARNGWTIAVGREDAGGAIGAGIGVTADLSRFRYRPADAPAAAASA